MAQAHPDPGFSTAAATRRGAARPMLHLALFGLAGGGLVCGVAFALTGLAASPLALGVGGYGVGLGLALALMRRGFPHPTLGLCNVVTLVRLALTAGLLAPLAQAPGHPWAVFAVATIALSLDGADGWLARRAGRVSDFGARFDMEVDSALALILTLNIWAAGTAGPMVLALGLPRYAFVAASAVLPWLNRPLPDRFSRKVVCVVQIAALIALLLPGFPASLGPVMVGGVAAALAWSFGRDVVWLWRHRA